MSHSFEELYELYKNQPNDASPEEEIEYFRTNRIRQINAQIRDNQATIVMEDADRVIHRASGTIPQQRVPPEETPKDLDYGFEGYITSEPLSLEERSLIDPNPDLTFFTSRDAFHGDFPDLSDYGITEQGTWFNTYRESLKYRYRPPNNDIFSPTPPEVIDRLLETSKLKFKYRFIKQNAVKLKNITFPFTVNTRSANINPRNYRQPPVKVEFTLLDAIYFATLHPHLIGGIKAETRGLIFRETKFKFLYLENTDFEDEPGTRVAREIMVNRRMFVPTATTTNRKPVVPVTAQTIPTNIEQKEIDESSSSVLSKEADSAAAEAQREAGSSRDASTQLDRTKPINRQVLFRGTLSGRRVTEWVSQLPNARVDLDTGVGETSEVSSRLVTQLVRITLAAGDDGLLDNDNEWQNINQYTEGFHDTAYDPERNKLDYEIKRVENLVYIQKLLKTPAPRSIEEAQETDSNDATSENKTSEVWNYDDWTTNVSTERGIVNTYINPRYPSSIGQSEGSYFAVMRAPVGVDTQDQFTQQAENIKNSMYQALCTNFNRPITDIPQEIRHEFQARHDPRPNSPPLIRLTIRTEEFNNVAAFGNIKSNLDELTLARAIQASHARAEVNFSFDLETIDNLFPKVAKVFDKYFQITRSQGLKSSDIGVNLRGEGKKIEQFPNKIRQALTYNGVFPAPKDQIEIGFTNEYEPLHIIHQSRMYFGGFKRATIPNEISETLKDGDGNPIQINEGEDSQFPSQLQADKNFFKRFDQTTFAYLYYIPNIIDDFATVKEEKDMMPWVDFVRKYTYPAPKIAPGKVNSQQKISDDEAEGDLTANAVEIESDNIHLNNEAAYTDSSLSTGITGGQVREVTQTQKTAEANNQTAINEKNEKAAKKASQLEIVVEDAVMNCGNLPNLVEQIKSLEDLFDMVLDQITLDELFDSLRTSLVQDMQKNFALLDLAEGFSPDTFRDGFNQFVETELACAVDQIGNALKNQILNKDGDPNLNNLPLDQLVTAKARDMFGINIPFIPISGILDFILELVSEVLKEALRQVLVALVTEALESFLDCNNIPLLDGDLANLGDIKNPADLLDYGNTRLGELVAGIDKQKLLDELGVNINLQVLEEKLDSLSDSLNSMEVLSLLSGNAGPLLMQIAYDIFGDDMSEEQVDQMFGRMGANVPNEIKSGIVPPRFYVDYCNKGDYIRAASRALDLLRDKGLSDEQIKNQTEDDIQRAAEKIKSMCDMEGLANEAVAGALNKIKAPAAVTALQGKGSAGIAAISQASITAEARPFILGRSAPKFGGFDIPLVGYGTDKLVTTGEGGNLNLVGSGGTNTSGVEIEYDVNGDQYKVGDLKITISEPTEPGQHGDDPQDNDTNTVTIVVHRKALNTNDILENGQIKDGLKESLRTDPNVLVYLQYYPDRSYRGSDRGSLRYVLETLLEAHKRTIDGFGISASSIERSYHKGSDGQELTDGEAAYLRTPNMSEAGKYKHPFMENIVLDRGNDLEVFNSYFNRDDIDLKKNPRQEFFESGPFNPTAVYEALYADIEEEPTLVNAGPHFQKKMKRTNAVTGLMCRLMPFFCTIWPLLDSDSNSKIVFNSEDRVFRAIIQNYLERMLRFDLQSSGLLDIYQKVLVEDDKEIQDVVQAVLENLFTDTIQTSDSNYKLKVRFDRQANAILSGDDQPSVALRANIVTNINRTLGPGLQPYEDFEDLVRQEGFTRFARDISRYYYPVEALLSVATIYLNSSSNIAQLLGVTFKQSSNNADQLLLKLYNPLL